VAVALSLANAKLSFGSQLGACNYAAIFRQLCVHVSEPCPSGGLFACVFIGRAPRQNNPQLMSRPRIICRLHRRSLTPGPD
jgi:hypothetical protein